MSSPGWPSLEIERSARSQSIVVASVLIVLPAVPFVARLPVMAAIAAALLATSLASVSFWRIGWLGGRRAIRRARWMDEIAWRIRGDDGLDWAAKLSPASRVMGPLVWLRFTTEAGPRHLLFWGDDLAPDARRRLVARLRLHADAGHKNGAEARVADADRRD